MKCFFKLNFFIASAFLEEIFGDSEICMTISDLLMFGINWGWFWIGFTSILVFLKLIEYITNFILRKSIKKSPEPANQKESVQWLNYITNRVMLYCHEPKIMSKINSKLAEKNITLVSLGNSPIISSIKTYPMKEADILHFLAAIDYENGPSLDIKISKLFKISVDILQLKSHLYIYWPSKDKNFLEFSFADKIISEIHLSVNLFQILTLNITQIPIVKSIVQDIVMYKLATLTFHLPLPTPKDVPSNSQNM